MTAVAAPAPAPLGDEHSVLLWQTCAYVEDLGDAARSGSSLTPAYDAMLEFLHYRMLPYLRDEERQLPATLWPDGHVLQLLVTDHEQLRADVENVEASRTRRMLQRTATMLVDRLARHVGREEAWFGDDPSRECTSPDVSNWSLPLLIGDVVDVDALPPDHCDSLIRQRLGWMRAGEVLRLESGSDLHQMWSRQHTVDRNAHIWVYEQAGPRRWRVRITRRDPDDV